jgi:TonB family protein
MTRATLAGFSALAVVLVSSLAVLRVRSAFQPGTVGSALGGIPGTLRPTPPPRNFRGPIRMAANVSPPRKVVHVEPTWPDAARACDLRGIVILELTIDTEGRVAATHILRSMPGLDEAAVAAVRQWAYEPTLLNGDRYSIVVAVTVSFPPKRRAPLEAPPDRPTGRA